MAKAELADQFFLCTALSSYVKSELFPLIAVIKKKWLSWNVKLGIGNVLFA
jgi:hypothetical protein